MISSNHILVFYEPDYRRKTSASLNSLRKEKSLNGFQISRCQSSHSTPPVSNNSYRPLCRPPSFSRTINVAPRDDLNFFWKKAFTRQKFIAYSRPREDEVASSESIKSYLQTRGESHVSGEA